MPDGQEREIEEEIPSRGDMEFEITRRMAKEEETSDDDMYETVELETLRAVVPQEEVE